MAYSQMTITNKVEIIESCDSLYLWFQSVEQQIYLFHDKDIDAGILCYNGNICYVDKRGMLNVSTEDYNTISVINGLLKKAKTTPMNTDGSVSADIK